MAEYKGIIAGIGNKATETNEISPAFDAKIYDLMVNESGIVDGFELNNITNNCTLSTGMLLCKGYRGILTTPVNFIKGQKVYARFVFNNDKNIVDTFSVWVDDGEEAETLTKTENIEVITRYSEQVNDYPYRGETTTMYYDFYQGNIGVGNVIKTVEISSDYPTLTSVSIADALLNPHLYNAKVYSNLDNAIATATVTITYQQEVEINETFIRNVTPEISGAYDILLIDESGEMYFDIERIKYPLQAENSDYAEEVRSRLLEGVTGVTAPLNSNNKVVATTEYVHKMVNEEINYTKKEVSVITTANSSIMGTITLEKKGGFVIATATGNANNKTTVAPAYISITIPTEFLPIQNENNTLAIIVRTSDINSNNVVLSQASILYFTISTTGNLTYQSKVVIYENATNTNVDEYLKTVIVSGWKTNIK